MGTTSTDRRLYPRVPLVLAARFDLGREATVRDLSAGGMRLEHCGPLRPGAECNVRFALDDDFYLFGAAVIWSRPIQPQDDGSAGLLFHSGLAFERVPKAAQRLLAALVGGL